MAILIEQTAFATFQVLRLYPPPTNTADNDYPFLSHIRNYLNIKKHYPKIFSEQFGKHPLSVSFNKERTKTSGKRLDIVEFDENFKALSLKKYPPFNKKEVVMKGVRTEKSSAPSPPEKESIARNIVRWFKIVYNTGLICRKEPVGIFIQIGNTRQSQKTKEVPQEP